MCTTCKTNEVMRKIKVLYRKMWRTCYFFHLFRNNPRSRERYYFSFISIVGYDHWDNVDETVRMNWESARLSFDRMFGMMKNFKENPEEYAKLLDCKAKEKTEAKMETEHLNELCGEVSKIVQQMSGMLKVSQNIIKDQGEELKKVKEMIAVKKELRKCYDEFGKLLSKETSADE